MAIGWSREKILLSGEPGMGKSEAMFDIARSILQENPETQVFFMVCDDGVAKYLRRLKKWIAPTETTQELGIPNGPDPRFYYHLTPDFMSQRKAYRSIRQNWTRGDWLEIDRVDLVWEAVQSYYSAMVEGISEDELDAVFMAKRVDKVQEAKRLEAMKDEDAKRKAKAIMMSITVAENRPLDWNLIKDGYNGIVWDAFAGRDSARMGINVVASTLVVPKGAAFTGDTNKKDPRTLDAYGVVVQGEKNLTGLPDTHLLLHSNPQHGYIVTTVKDRDRKRLIGVPVDHEVGLWDIYRSKVILPSEAEEE